MAPRFVFSKYTRNFASRSAAAVLVVSATSGVSFGTPRPTALRSVNSPSEASSGISFGRWLEELLVLLDAVPAPSVDAEYTEFVAANHLPEANPQLKTDYRRVRLLFEAVRDGGFWHLRWDITDQQPSSRRIWKHWLEAPVLRGFAEPSVTAECDESSALMGMLARHLKLNNVGLFYPTWNHTIAVWAPLAGKPKRPVVQLPTTQIFLDCGAGFDKTTFLTGLRNIESYPNWDVRKDTLIPSERAEWLLSQLRDYAAASPLLWSLIRAKRAHLMRSSMGACGTERQNWQQTLHLSLTSGDTQTLLTLAKKELSLETTDPTTVLAWLGQ
jgi:hypothetical protein